MARTTSPADPSDIINTLLCTELARGIGFEAALVRWTTDSNRFVLFLTKYIDTIRKKIKSACQENDLWDVFYELETAYYICLDESLDIVEYQPRVLVNGDLVRSPDFLLLFETNFEFYLEVKRIREIDEATRARFVSDNDDDAAEDEEELDIFELQNRDIIIKDALFEKLTQFVPSKPNVLLIFTESADFTVRSLQGAFQIIHQAKTNGNEHFFAHRKWQGNSGSNFFFRVDGKSLCDSAQDNIS